MRVVVVGATGNVGSALLRRFAADEDPPELVGVARRVPIGPVAAPFDVPRWVACDVSQPACVPALTEAFTGADAVVHLAWAIQPSHDRHRLRAVNVAGTGHVVEATRRARVPHLVVASSVGAYSPVHDDVPRDESWPTDGVRTSTYSVDKSAQERLLDRAEQSPGTVVARVRPALVFQRGAASEVGRLFLGPFVPKRLLTAVPVLPWPAGLRLQAVHADDLADAYHRVVLARATGAFNVAGPGLLRGADVARILDARSTRDVPPALVRAALAAGWAARVAPVGPGWLDMGMSAPVLDTTRIQDELGWRALRTGFEAVTEAVRGLVDGAGDASPPLHARRRLVPTSGAGR